MKQLQTHELREDIFDKILYELRYRVQEVSEEFFSTLIYGYSEKNVIYYEKCADGNEYFICKESVLNYYTDAFPYCTNWKQCRVRKVTNINSIIQHTITGNHAYNLLMKILRDYYAQDEIETILNAHTAPYNESLKQVHITVGACDKGKIYKFENCYKYDINGAHCAALVEMFPKAKNRLIKLYEERKSKPENKQLFNFAVGCLVPKKHRETYNWIVQRTTKKLNEAIELTNGNLLYANTDGFVVQYPENLIEHSKILDEFKEEYHGDVYFYLGNNYNLYQFGDEMRGSCKTSVRNRIDLRKGKVVEYKTKREYYNDGKKYLSIVDENSIIEREVEIYEA